MGRRGRIQLLATLVLLLLTASGGATFAQQAPLPFPSTPPAGSTDSAGADLQAWRAQRLATAGARRPILLEAQRLGLMLTTRTEVYGGNPGALVESVLVDCELGLLDAEVADLSASAPWQAFDESLAAPTWELTLWPETGDPQASCAADYEARLALAMAALQLEPRPTPAARLLAAELRVDGRPVTPRLAGRRAIRRLAPARQRLEDGTQLRMYFDLDAVAPRADGSWPIVSVLVWREQDVDPEAFELPQRILQQLARQQLAYRLSQLDAPPAGPWLSLPTHGVDALEQAARLHADGRLAAAGLVTLAAIDSGLLRPQFRERSAYAGVAQYLAVGGDSVGARIAVEAALQTEPCLRMNPASGSPVVAAFNSVTLDASCHPLSLGRAARTAWFFPGYGQLVQARSSERRVVGGLFLGASAGLVASALYTQAKARDEFEEYMGLRLGSFAAAYYARAEDTWARANTLLVTAAAVWGISFVEHLVWESFRNARLRRLANYGTPSGPTLRLGAGPNGALGLSIQVEF